MDPILNGPIPRRLTVSVAGQGLTWPEDNGADSYWAVGAEFDAPNIPRKDGGTDDWGSYPRTPVNSDLLTMRVDPASSYGWMVADKLTGSGSSVAFGYVWERKDFPWLMTWEENKARAQAPWSSNTLCRGLEFGSCEWHAALCQLVIVSQHDVSVSQLCNNALHTGCTTIVIDALAMGRRYCVEKGQMLGQPTFEWLDAYEEKETTFWITLQSLQNPDPAGAPKLVPSADGQSMEAVAAGFHMPLH